MTRIFWSICEFSTGRSIEFQYEFSELFSFCMEYPDNSYRVLKLSTDSIHSQIFYWYTDPTVHVRINPWTGDSLNQSVTQDTYFPNVCL
eukprot:COSAG02_NODE_1328_length_13219_cov_45.612652_11_plen_89_part_00